MIRVITDDVERLLSPSQLRVFKLAAQGFTNKEIANQLGRDDRTTSTQTYRICEKLGLRTPAQMRAFAAMLYGKYEVTHEYVTLRLRSTIPAESPPGSDRVDEASGGREILKPLDHPVLRSPGDHREPQS